MTADEALHALIEALEELRQLLPASKGRWDADRVLRLAIERLWITAGNAAERYRLAAGIDAGDDPWAELVAYRHRLAHALPSDISSERVWSDSTGDLPRLLTEVREHMN